MRETSGSGVVDGGRRRLGSSDLEVGALQQGKQRSVEAIRHWPVSPAEAAASLRLVANDLAWLATFESTLVGHLD